MWTFFVAFEGSMTFSNNWNFPIDFYMFLDYMFIKN